MDYSDDVSDGTNDVPFVHTVINGATNICTRHKCDGPLEDVLIVVFAKDEYIENLGANLRLRFLHNRYSMRVVYIPASIITYIPAQPADAVVAVWKCW